MYKINTKNTTLVEGISIMSEYWKNIFPNNELEFEIIPVFVKDLNGYSYEYNGINCKIRYSHESSLYRGITHFIRTKKNQHQETRSFEELSLSLDLSRNAVMTEEYIKQFLCRLSSLGYDTCFLYMEDVYELKEYQYFGYLRGRYSSDFLKELDQFAKKIGIELVPSIQTLSHLERPLKWFEFNKIKDTFTSLKVYEKETYEFIEAMIKNISECFESKRIHVGMDEALELGQGAFLKTYPYETQEKLFLYHLKKVIEITEKYEKEPLIWSDMLLRVLSKSGEYYDSEVSINEEYAKTLPQLSLVYWDYYHSKVEEYEAIIEKHLQMTESLYFAGGIWIFNGISPNQGRMLTNTISAIEACKKKNIQKIIATIWMDDGAETPIYAAFLGIQLFAESQYNDTSDMESLSRAFNIFQNESLEDHLLLNQFDQTPGTKENNPYSSAISKIILYQDTLLGLFDKNISELPLAAHYKKLHEDLIACKNKSTLLEHYEKIAYILSLKAELGIKISEAYKTIDIKELQDSANILTVLIDKYKELEKSHLELWLETNKKYGWDVINRRYYSVIGQLVNTRRELEKKITNPEYMIEELEVEKLPYSDWYSDLDGCIATNLFEQIVSVNKL